MDWGQLLALLLILFRTDVAVIQLANLGYGPLFTLVVTIEWTFFATTFAFCLAGILDKKVLERKGLRTKFFKLAWVKRIHTSIKKGEKKWINWLLRHNKLLIFVIIFIPFTPWIEGPAVVAARLARIKGALLLLLLASAGKMLLMAFFVYC